MRPVSDAFLRSLRGSHVATFRARVCPPGQTGTDPDGTEIPILAGDVVLDATAEVRGTLTLTTPGRNMWPRSTGDLLAPYGNEVFVERGIQFGNGITEWVSQGYFRIETVEQEDAPDDGITITGSDRMQGVLDARLLHLINYTTGEGWQVGQILSDLINGTTYVYPWAQIEWDDATEFDPIPRSVVVEEDRFEFLDNMIKSRGKIWYWDHRGVLVVKDPPDPGVPVWDVNAGRDGVLVQMGRDLSREGVYNGVTAYGEATDTLPPALAYAVDLDPNSPTYWYGNFGLVTRRYFSSFITTTAQAKAAAEAILRQSLGAPYNVNFGSIANPALEPFDPVTVTYPTRARSGTMHAEAHILERITVPLTSDQPLAADTREHKVGVIGAPT